MILQGILTSEQAQARFRGKVDEVACDSRARSNSIQSAFHFVSVDANPFPADLARALSMPKPSMTFLIKKLEESGYLRRQGEKGDLRRYRLTITPAGIKARDKGAEAVNGIFGACLNSLSAADQATFSRIVDQLQPRTSKTKQRNT